MLRCRRFGWFGLSRWCSGLSRFYGILKVEINGLTSISRRRKWRLTSLSKSIKVNLVFFWYGGFNSSSLGLFKMKQFHERYFESLLAFTDASRFFRGNHNGTKRMSRVSSRNSDVGSHPSNRARNPSMRPDGPGRLFYKASQPQENENQM